MACLDKLRGHLELFLSLVLRHLAANPAAVRASFDLVLRRKGIAAEAMAIQRETVLGGRYPALADRLTELTHVRGRIAQAIWSRTEQDGAAAEAEGLRTRQEELETELARNIPEMDLAARLRTADAAAAA